MNGALQCNPIGLEVDSILRDHSGEVIKVIRAIVSRSPKIKRKSVVDEIVQETYLDLLENAQRLYRPADSTFSTYVGGKAAFMAGEYLARLGKRGHHADIMELPKSEKMPRYHVEYDKQQNVDEIMRSIDDEVDGKMKTILHSRFVGGMTLEAIGGLVGLTKERIRQKIDGWISEKRLSYGLDMG